MASIADKSVKIPTTSESNVSIPSWFGQVCPVTGASQGNRLGVRAGQG